jgi:hypothetical protein
VDATAEARRGRPCQVGGQEDVEELVDPVHGQVSDDRPGLAVGGLAVPAVDGRLLGHAPEPEPGPLGGDRPVPDGRVEVGVGQHPRQPLNPVLEPAD